MNSEEQYIEMEAARIDSSEQYFSARPQIDWADRRRVFEAGFDRGWKAALKSQAKSGPAEGEEIMVNTPYDVFTLSLKPSGLTSGPRFVVHVPGPEQTAAVDGAIDKARFERAPCYLCGYNGPGYYQPDTHPCAAKYHDADSRLERHPDDVAVDRFAAAMKTKLRKKRQEGRSGWQSMTAEQLSALLHEHVHKGDPINVVNLAMMLHQNGQELKPPATVTTDEMVADIELPPLPSLRITPSVSPLDYPEVEKVLMTYARAAVLADRKRAVHPAITFCDKCGCDWLDNGLNPVSCPYCEQSTWREAFIAERATRYREKGWAIEQARIFAEADAALIGKQFPNEEAPDND